MTAESQFFEPRIDALRDAIRWIMARAPAWADAQRLELGLTEALTNAVVHGALEVSSSSRAAGLEDYLADIARAESRALASGRSLGVALERTAERFSIQVSWDGASCPPEHRLPHGPAADRPTHGMGLSIIYAMFDDVSWAKDGRAMSLDLHNGDSSTQLAERP